MLWFLLLILALPATTLNADPQTRPSTRPAPSRDEIRRAVRQLNHPNLTQRRKAIRQLAEWGPLAFGELREAANSSSLESALSARDLLQELEEAILIGAEVRLEVDRQRLAWNEPLTLRVRAHNPTDRPLRVPWERPTTSRPADQIPSHVQVARILDAADFLVITGPHGHPVELRPDLWFDRESPVFDILERRVHGSGPAHIIEAGQSAVLDIPLFNRGWIRYPLLEAGTYTLHFVYQPRWKDPGWTQEGFGRIVSNPIRIEVVEGAPEAIRRASRPLRMSIAIKGDKAIAQVTSDWDVPLWLNLNFGGQKEASAQVRWELVPLRIDDPEPVPVLHEPEDTRVALERIVQIDPGTTRTIAELPMEKVREEHRRLVSDTPFHYALQARYTNFATTKTLQDVLRVAAEDVPMNIFTGALDSNDIELPR